MTTKNKKQPMRRCVGCMESKPKNKLVRIAYYEGKLTLDETGRAKGRGLYMCPNKECIELAKKKKALNRGFEAEMSQEDIENIFRELEKYGEQSN